ncbi:MAG: hypothetical protein RLZZ455_80 [Candidatus Parcubacteria bacterium]
MKLTEVRHPSYEYKPSALVSTPPVLDIERAKSAQKDAELYSVDSFYPHEHPSLVLATSLIFYHHNLNRDTIKGTPQEQDIVRLRTRELAAAETTAFLPTIGIEIEADLEPYRMQTEIANLQYEVFFRTLRMPSNHASSVNDYWEFSPPPSYSAFTTSRIAYELLRGRYIPSLATNRQRFTKGIKYTLSNKDQKRITTNLSQYLRSAHINFGVPSETMLFSHDTNELKQDITTLSASLALAYTSQRRLTNRVNLNLLAEIHNDAQPTAKKPTFDRLELLPFEIGAASSLELFINSQYLAAALFAYHSEQRDTALARCWQQFSEFTSALVPSLPLETEKVQKLDTTLGKDNELREKLRTLVKIYSRHAMSIADQLSNETIV